MPTIHFVNEKKQVHVAEGADLRRAALDAGVKLYHGINGYGAKLNEVVNCRGFGHCGTCRVLVTKGMDNANKMTLMEKFTFRLNPLGPAMFAYIGNEDTMRLACKTRVFGDMEVVTCPEFNFAGENFFS